MEFRSIVEPIRNTGFRDEHHFHLSHASGLDTNKQVVECTSALDSSIKYTVPYDDLVIGVGAVSNTFGIEGVEENALYLKVSYVMFVLKGRCIIHTYNIPTYL